MEISKHTSGVLTVTYMPHKESRLFNALYPTIIASLHYLAYKKFFDENKLKFKNHGDNNWWIYTVNAYYDLAIINWCKLFGTYSEPTHYYNLIKTSSLLCDKLKKIIDPCDKQTLKRFLLDKAGVTLEEFEIYHKNTMDYRNRNVIHEEHSPEKINSGDLARSSLDIAKKTLTALFFIIIKLANQFPKENDQIYQFRFEFLKYDNEDQLYKDIARDFPSQNADGLFV